MAETITDNVTDTKIVALQRMYEAFGTGDVEAILADVAEDVEWGAVPSSAAAPWYGTYRGKSEVPRFFAAIGANVTVTEFVPLTFTSNDEDVIVALRWAFTVNATGRHVVAEMAHWFRFAEGKVVFVRTYEDTAQAAAAFA